jgi:hypothetical protein
VFPQRRLQFQKDVLNFGLVCSGGFGAEFAYSIIDRMNREHGLKLPRASPEGIPTQMYTKRYASGKTAQTQQASKYVDT